MQLGLPAITSDLKNEVYEKPQYCHHSPDECQHLVARKPSIEAGSASSCRTPRGCRRDGFIKRSFGSHHTKSHTQPRDSNFEFFPAMELVLIQPACSPSARMDWNLVRWAVEAWIA